MKINIEYGNPNIKLHKITLNADSYWSPYDGKFYFYKTIIETKKSLFGIKKRKKDITIAIIMNVQSLFIE